MNITLNNILKLYSELSIKPKECFCQLRKFYNLSIEDFLERAKLSHKVYDNIMGGKKISKISCIKMCLGFSLPVTVMKKVLSIFGHNLNENDINDAEILLKYEKYLAKFPPLGWESIKN